MLRTKVTNIWNYSNYPSLLYSLSILQIVKVKVIFFFLQMVMNMAEDDPRRMDEIRKYAAIYGRFDCKRKPEKPLTLHEVCTEENHVWIDSRHSTTPPPPPSAAVATNRYSVCQHPAPQFRYCQVARHVSINSNYGTSFKIQSCSDGGNHRVNE